MFRLGFKNNAYVEVKIARKEETLFKTNSEEENGNSFGLLVKIL
jgi:hypothetical protein